MASERVGGSTMKVAKLNMILVKMAPSEATKDSIESTEGGGGNVEGDKSGGLNWSNKAVEESNENEISNSNSMAMKAINQDSYLLIHNHQKPALQQ